MSVANVVGFRFSRDDVLTGDGFAQWREIIGRSILKLDLSLLPDHCFHSEALTYTFPGLRLSFATKSGLRMERTRECLIDGTDGFGLHICNAGTWNVSHRARARSRLALVTQCSFQTQRSLPWPAHCQHEARAFSFPARR